MPEAGFLPLPHPAPNTLLRYNPLAPGARGL